MAITNKEYILNNETYEKAGETKTFGHRIGELITFSKQDGGTFQKIKLYLIPNADLYLAQDPRFKDEAPQDSTAGNNNW